MPRYTVDDVCDNPLLLTQYSLLIYKDEDEETFVKDVEEEKDAVTRDLKRIFKALRNKSLSVGVWFRYECNHTFKFVIQPIEKTDMCLITCQREQFKSAAIFNIKENKYVDVTYKRPHLDIEDDRGVNGSEIFWFMRSFDDEFEDLDSVYVDYKYVDYNVSIEYIIEHHMFVNDVFDFSSLLDQGNLTKRGNLTALYDISRPL